MNKHRKKKYQVNIYSDIRHPYGLTVAVGHTRSILDGLSRRQADQVVRRMSYIYPHQFRYRIKKRGSMGLSGIVLFCGLALFVLCLAMANATPTLFSTMPSDFQDLIRVGFQVLAIGGLLVGLFKGLN